MSNALWVKAPVLLILRFRSLFVGVLVGGAILAAAATSGPAFIASSERASLRNEISRATRWTAGLHVAHPVITFNEITVPPGDLELMGSSGAKFLTRLTEDVSGLGDVHTTYFGDTSNLVSQTDNVPVRLVDRTRALENIRFVERSEVEGLYIADETARQLAVDVGDTLTIEGPRRPAEVTVAGLYRFLPFDRDREFWMPYANSIYRATDADTYPPLFVFASPGTFFSLAESIGDFNDIHWEVPLATTDVSLREAQRLDRDLQRIIQQVRGNTNEFKGFDEFNQFLLGADTALPGVVNSAEERIVPVVPAVELLSLAARAVAGVILGALGYYLVKRRRTEVLTLVARGASPISIGFRAGLESLIPMLLGGVVGWLVGAFAVARLGPEGRFDLGDAIRSWQTAAWTLVAGLALLVITVAVTTAREERSIAGAEHHRLPRTLAAAVGAIAAAVGAAAYIAYLAPSASTRDPAGLVPTLMPVVLIFAAAVAGAVVVKIVIGWFASAARRRAVSTYLAAKRLSASPGMVLVLIAAAACAVGVMFYGAAVSRSVAETAQAKARVFVGSDVGVQLSANADIPDLPLDETVVARVGRATLTNGLDVAMIGVEPDTFEEAVYWEESFSESSLQELLSRLSPDGTRLRAIAVGAVPSQPTIGGEEADVPVEIVGKALAFPGQNSSDPMLVVHRDAFDDVLGSIGASLSSREAQLWARGTEQRVERVLQRTEVSYFSIVTARTILEAPALQSTLWTLGLLSALGAASGVAAVAGLLLYMQARHRSALVSSAMTRRMRLQRSSEFRSWLLEVGTSMGAAYLIAGVVGLGVARLMHERLDLRPTLPPEPVLVVPVGAMVLAAIAGAALAGLTAKRLQAQIDKANMGEVLRT